MSTSEKFITAIFCSNAYGKAFSLKTIHRRPFHIVWFTLLFQQLVKWFTKVLKCFSVYSVSVTDIICNEIMNMGCLKYSLKVVRFRGTKITQTNRGNSFDSKKHVALVQCLWPWTLSTLRHKLTFIWKITYLLICQKRDNAGKYQMINCFITISKITCFKKAGPG